MKRTPFAVLVILSLLAAFSCSGGGDGSKNAGLLLLSAGADPCLFVASPLTGSGLATDNAYSTNHSVASVRGRVVTASGTPVVGALIMVDNSLVNDAVHYGGHSSIDRDGYFEISGILVTDGPFILAIEPLDSSFYDRIDDHLKCFHAPESFTAGWYAGNGSTIVTSRASASSFTLTAGQIRDLGTLRLIQ